MRSRHSLIGALVCFAFAAACLFLLVAPAGCDDSWVIVVGSAADLASTEYALAQNPTGLREGNPLLREQGTRIALKLAGTAALVYVYKRVKKKDPRAARVVAIAVGSLFLSVTAWNVAQTR